MNSPPSTGDEKVLQMSRPGMQEAFQNIMDTFTGADGGVAVYQLMSLCTVLDKEAAAGDKDAAAVLNCIPRLGKLIEIAKRGGKVR